MCMYMCSEDHRLRSKPRRGGCLVVEVEQAPAPETLPQKAACGYRSRRSCSD